MPCLVVCVCDVSPTAFCGMQVIARVQGLTMLNGSAVRQRERRDCELRYLRAVVGMYTQACICPIQATCVLSCIRFKTKFRSVGMFTPYVKF